MTRWFAHLFAGSAHAMFPQAVLDAVAAAVAAGERNHRGEICFAVEAALSMRGLLAGRTARTRAHEVFSQLRVWDTAHNNGVLVYLLLAEHRIEIVADRGLDGRVSAEQWRGVCQLMEERLAAGDAQDAALAGVAAVSALLAEHFPRAASDQDENELPDAPHML